MVNTSDLLTSLAATLEKYRKNKTLVSPEDLAGKYKVPFRKLEAQLQKEIGEYLKAHSLEGLTVVNDEHLDEFIAAVNQMFSDPVMRKQAGRAAFEDFSLEEIKQIAEQLRNRVYNKAWEPYMQNYTCLYATAECFAEDNPQIPRIYNSLVDKFWDDEKKKWIRVSTPMEPALLIHIQNKEKGRKEA